MIVLSPDNTSHQIKVIPRYYTEGAVNLILRNEASGESETIELQPEISNGYMRLSFNKTFADNSNYQITITEGSDCVYRGKLFVTNQANDTQNYSISKDVFTYE